MGAEDTPSSEGDEIVTDAISRLHPILQQALDHPLAKAAPNCYPERQVQVLKKEDEALRLGQLFYCIDAINGRVAHLVAMCGCGRGKT